MDQQNPNLTNPSGQNVSATSTNDPGSSEAETVNQSPSTNPTKPGKKIVLIVAVVLLLLAAGSAAAYFLVFKNQATPSPSPTPAVESTPDPTADWKTYSNSEYSYSIQYPDTWATRNVAAGAGESEALPNSRQIEIYEKDYPKDYKFEGITIQVLENPSLPQKTITLNGLTMYVFDTQEGEIYYVKIPTKNSYLEFTGAGGYTADENKNNIIKQIFSTFKFTDNNRDLKTYTGKSFTFNYPSSWNYDGSYTITSPNGIKIVANEEGTMMNECTQEQGTETKTGYVLKKYNRVANTEACAGGDILEKQIWVIKTSDSYGPGLQITYKSSIPSADKDIETQ